MEWVVFIVYKAVVIV